MLEKLLEVLIRIATALEKLASAPTTGNPPAENTEPAKRTRSTRTTAAAEEKTAAAAAEQEKLKSNPFADDEAAAPKRTKEEVRKTLTDYANATSNEKALEELAKVTSNKAQRVPDIKPEEYNAVFDAFSKLLAEAKK